MNKSRSELIAFQYREPFLVRGVWKRLELRNVLFLDPGLGGTGWAFFPCVTLPVPGEIVIRSPSDWGVIPGKAWDGWLDKVKGIARALCSMHRFTVTHAVLETPEVWETAVSHAAATGRKSGEPANLFKLTFLVGFLSAAIQAEWNSTIQLVLPALWKGQLPKEVVIQRVERVVSLPRKLRNHEADAVGMGCAAQGLFLKSREVS